VRLTSKGSRTNKRNTHRVVRGVFSRCGDTLLLAVVASLGKSHAADPGASVGFREASTPPHQADDEVDGA